MKTTGAPVPPDALAWLILAGCEAIAHEPSGAAADRLRILREVVDRTLRA